jgi:hypothetical protein
MISISFCHHIEPVGKLMTRGNAYFHLALIIDHILLRKSDIAFQHFEECREIYDTF